MGDLPKLPNFGPTLADKLNRIGVIPIDKLADMGSVEAVMRIGQTDESACYNIRYAIEDAICGVRWHAIPKDERGHLKAEFNH